MIAFVHNHSVITALGLAVGCILALIIVVVRRLSKAGEDGTFEQ